MFVTVSTLGVDQRRLLDLGALTAAGPDSPLFLVPHPGASAAFVRRRVLVSRARASFATFDIYRTPSARLHALKERATLAHRGARAARPSPAGCWAAAAASNIMRRQRASTSAETKVFDLEDIETA